MECINPAFHNRFVGSRQMYSSPTGNGCCPPLGPLARHSLAPDVETGPDRCFRNGDFNSGTLPTCNTYCSKWWLHAHMHAWSAQIISARLVMDHGDPHSDCRNSESIVQPFTQANTYYKLIDMPADWNSTRLYNLPESKPDSYGFLLSSLEPT